jgi:hypothetical protein
MDEGARLCAAGDLLAQRNHGAELLLLLFFLDGKNITERL